MLTQHSETCVSTSNVTKLIFKPVLGGLGLLVAVICVTQAFSQPNAISSTLRNDCYRHVSEKIAAHKKALLGHGIADGYSAELHSRCD